MAGLWGAGTVTVGTVVRWLRAPPSPPCAGAGVSRLNSRQRPAARDAEVAGFRDARFARSSTHVSASLETPQPENGPDCARLRGSGRARTAGAGGDPHRRRRGRPAPAGRGAGRRGRGRRRGHPAAAAAHRRRWACSRPGGSCRTSRATRRPVRPELVEALVAGARVLLVTDAGMPSVSDPGLPAGRGGGGDGRRVTAVPGPVRGADRARACPGCPSTGSASRGSCRARRGSGLARLAELAPRSAHPGVLRGTAPAAATLAAMAEAFGADRRAAVCRELTKTYEEVAAGRWPSWPVGGRRRPRGDHRGRRGAHRRPRPPTRPSWRAAVADREAPAARRARTAIAAVAQPAGLPKREVYDAVHRGEAP